MQYVSIPPDNLVLADGLTGPKHHQHFIVVRLRAEDERGGRHPTRQAYISRHERYGMLRYY
jgi:hypothetical protein